MKYRKTAVSEQSDRREERQLRHAYDAERKRESRRHVDDDDLDTQIRETGLEPLKVKR